MTNIWADPYKEVRKPFFDTESLEEERAKKDYDGDGKVESGAKEHAGAVHNAIQKKKGGKPDGQDTSSVKEEVEETEEGYQPIGKEQKTAMYHRAGNLARTAVSSTGKKKQEAQTKSSKIVSVLNREEVEEIDEAQEARNNPEKYEREQSKKYAPVRGERTPMPPRGNKKREDFERWYRANVREEAETITEVDSCSTPKKVDVMKGGKKNKVTINPPIREEVEAWIGELVEEGYDISEFTMDEMIEIYESVALEEQMPATGDAQTANTTDSAQLSAKRRMAQAQIRADLARVQFQKASMTKESVDSIVEYLLQRADAFENLEEGVFDPKKSKMRPASERTQRVMTDAQRKAAKKESERVAAIHSKGETVLAGMRPQGKRGKVKTTPDAKPAAPAANRTVRGRYDKLAAAANKVLKSTQKDK